MFQQFILNIFCHYVFTTLPILFVSVPEEEKGLRKREEETLNFFLLLVVVSKYQLIQHISLDAFIYQ